MPDVVVVGGGHNGLVAACYLSAAGRDVLVVEQSDRLGGGSRTEELLPGYRFDTHSVAHNLIQATGIVEELRLAEAGLVYTEMDPFSVAVFPCGKTIRFYRSVARTVESIRQVAPDDAGRYAAWMEQAMPVAAMAALALRAGGSGVRGWRHLPAGAGALARALARNGGPGGLARLLVSPYGRVLAERLGSDLVRAPVAAFAAHGSAAPDQPGTALFALWQAFYHLVGQWHAAGGSQALTDALARRLATSGGGWRTGAAVTAVSRDSAGVTGVVLESGETIPARTVVTAIDPRAALLGLLDPPLAGPPAAALAGAHSGNAVQMLVLIAARRLPPYPGAQPADYRGLQSYVDSLDSLSDAFAQAGAGRLPRDPVPAYAFTPSACDPSLAPAGRHTVYLACPAAPARLEGGWGPARETFADRLIAAVEARAPGFTESITDRVIRTPDDMTRELRWPGAHPMHLDVTLDQIGPFRPAVALGRHRTPVPGLYVSGAGTSPTGGISGAPGRAAAGAVLRDQRRRQR
jgi:phytoene dehydrogenase-like protein